MGRANLIPKVSGVFEATPCAHRVAFGQGYLCASERRAGSERLALEHICDTGEFVCRIARGFKVAGRELDFDHRLEQGCPA
jgi:hypothetical protein